MVSIRIEGVIKRYGDNTALNGITLEVHDKEFMSLVGPSGCGKTTLLRIIAGLISPDEGDIYFDDNRVTEISPQDRNVGMVFQNYALYPHMSTYDNISFGLRLKRVSKDQVNRRVQEVSESLGISHLLNRKPKELSGGEQQRVALGRALARSPEVFLMDEPLSNLDAKLRVYMRAELKRIQKDLDITTVYVTHDQLEAMAMSDRMSVMNKGDIHQTDTPINIYDHPENLFVAGFIGSPPMNLFEGNITKKARRNVLDLSWYNLDLSTLPRHRQLDEFEGELMIGIRPDDITIDDVEGMFKAKITLVQPLGATQFVHLSVGDKLITCNAPVDQRVKVGDDKFVRFDTRRIHLFNKKKESRIHE